MTQTDVDILTVEIMDEIRAVLHPDGSARRNNEMDSLTKRVRNVLAQWTVYDPEDFP